jgi:hypothetical protein
MPILTCMPNTATVSLDADLDVTFTTFVTNGLDPQHG